MGVFLRGVPREKKHLGCGGKRISYGSLHGAGAASSRASGVVRCFQKSPLGFLSKAWRSRLLLFLPPLSSLLLPATSCLHSTLPASYPASYLVLPGDSLGAASCETVATVVSLWEAQRSDVTRRLRLDLAILRGCEL